jgi:hypothetical protein
MIGYASRGRREASRDAGAIPAASTFSKHASTNDPPRPITTKAVSSDGVPTHQDESGSRQVETLGTETGTRLGDGNWDAISINAQFC